MTMRNIFNLLVKRVILPLLDMTVRWAEFSAKSITQAKSNLERVSTPRKTAKEIEEQYTSFFDEESENTKKEGYEQLKEYLEEELRGLSTTDEINTKEEAQESKRSKVSDDTSGNKGSLIDDYANPNNEFGDWTGGDD